MESHAERGQVLVEMIVVCLMIAGLFVFIFDRGQLTREELAKSRFQSTSPSPRHLQDMKTYDVDEYLKHRHPRFSQPQLKTGENL